MWRGVSLAGAKLMSMRCVYRKASRRRHGKWPISRSRKCALAPARMARSTLMAPIMPRVSRRRGTRIDHRRRRVGWRNLVAFIIMRPRVPAFARRRNRSAAWPGTCERASPVIVSARAQLSPGAALSSMAKAPPPAPRGIDICLCRTRQHAAQ